MRWLQFSSNKQTCWGIVEGDRVIAVSGDPFGEWQRTQHSHALADVKIELPVMPRTFYCVGLNYLKHLKEAADKRGDDALRKFSRTLSDAAGKRDDGKSYLGCIQDAASSLSNICIGWPGMMVEIACL